MISHKHMPLTILPGGIVLDPHDVGAQQLQAHAERLGLGNIHIVRATIVGHRHTYLVLDRLRPVFEDAAPNVVAQHLDRMAHGQQAA